MTDILPNVIGDAGHGIEATPVIQIGSNGVPALFSDTGEQWGTVTETEKNVFASFDKASVTATGYAVLVDLSDTVNFPHDEIGRIDLSAVYISIDRDAAATGDIRLGVITRIDGTDADVTWVQNVDFEKSEDRHIARDLNFSPSQLKLGQTGGVLTRVVTSRATTIPINTGSLLDSSIGPGTVTPAVGDLVLGYIRLAGSYDFEVSAFYHTDASLI